MVTVKTTAPTANKRIRIGVYPRISTHPQAESSLELQRQHFEEQASQMPNYELVKRKSREGKK